RPSCARQDSTAARSAIERVHNVSQRRINPPRPPRPEPERWRTMNALWWLRWCCALVFAIGFMALPAPSSAQIQNAKATHVGDTAPDGSDGESSVTFQARAILDPSV